MSKVDETVAIGNVPAEGESTPEHSAGKHPAKTKYRVSVDGPAKDQVVLNVTNGYAKSPSGMLNFVQMATSLACLVTLVNSGVLQFGHDRDDKVYWWWRYRLLIFVSVFSSLVSLSSLFLHTCGVIEILPMDWYLFVSEIPHFWMFDFCISMGILHFVSCTLVLDSDFHLNDPRRGSPPDSSSHNFLIAAMVFSYLCVVAYLASAVVTGLDIRRQLRRDAKRESAAPKGDTGEGGRDSQRFQLFQQPSNSTEIAES